MDATACAQITCLQEGDDRNRKLCLNVLSMSICARVNFTSSVIDICTFFPRLFFFFFSPPVRSGIYQLRVKLVCMLFLAPASRLTLCPPSIIPRPVIYVLQLFGCAQHPVICSCGHAGSQSASVARGKRLPSWSQGPSLILQQANITLQSITTEQAHEVLGRN